MTKWPEPASLQRIKATKASGKDAKTVFTPVGAAIEVQFNPTSLRVTYTNNIDLGGVTTNDQRRQNSSAQSATLNFDLEFDTAEERAGQNPVDVRRRTAMIRNFAEPSVDEPQDPPPLLKFVWGTFSFVGIVTQLIEELDFFSPQGRPLRAKVSVTMKEVRPEIEAKAVGPATRTSRNATPPGKSNPSSGAPGSPPVSNPDRVVVAQAGESVQQLLARQDADPATWRSAMTELESPLSLPAGAQVQLAAASSAGPGLGAANGFAADNAVSSPAALAGALGVSEGLGATEAIPDAAATGAFPAAAGAPGDGFALAEGGGVVASARTVATSQVQASVTAARAAFDVPAVRTPVQVADRPGLCVDPRAQTFGRGIPLRPRPGCDRPNDSCDP